MLCILMDGQYQIGNKSCLHKNFGSFPFEPPPLQLSGCILFAPPPDARAIFLHNVLGGGGKQKRSQLFVCLKTKKLSFFIRSIDTRRRQLCQ